MGLFFLLKWKQKRTLQMKLYKIIIDSRKRKNLDDLFEKKLFDHWINILNIRIK